MNRFDITVGPLPPSKKPLLASQRKTRWHRLSRVLTTAPCECPRLSRGSEEGSLFPGELLRRSPGREARPPRGPASAPRPAPAGRPAWAAVCAPRGGGGSGAGGCLCVCVGVLTRLGVDGRPSILPAAGQKSRRDREYFSRVSLQVSLQGAWSK